MELFAKLFSSLLVLVYHCFDRIVIHGYSTQLLQPPCYAKSSCAFLTRSATRTPNRHCTVHLAHVQLACRVSRGRSRNRSRARGNCPYPSE
jgi:hypothetical protein